MLETVRKCDVQDCNSKAEKFSFFKERKMDGAGSSETWDYEFDLCQVHLFQLVNKLLSVMEQSHKALLLSYLKEMKVTLREG